MTFDLSLRTTTTAALQRTCAALVLLAAAAVHVPARAGEPLDIQLRYTVQFPTVLPEITRLMTFNLYENGYGAWWGGAGYIPGGVTSYTVTDPFLKSSANAPLSAFAVGLVQDLPNDAPGQKHVVLLMDTLAAQASQNIAWGTLFRNTTEEQLIANLEMVTSGLPFEEIQPAVDAMFTFALGDATNGILVPPGVPRSAFFSLGSVQPGSTTFSGFKVMAFSDGQIIGDGVAAVDATAVAVPEPVPAAMLAAGLGLLAWLRRRRG